MTNAAVKWPKYIGYEKIGFKKTYRKYALKYIVENVLARTNGILNDK